MDTAIKFPAKQAKQGFFFLSWTAIFNIGSYKKY